MSERSVFCGCNEHGGCQICSPDEDTIFHVELSEELVKRLKEDPEGAVNKLIEDEIEYRKQHNLPIPKI